MLLFRSEEHVDRWCTQWRLPRGATLTVEQLWRLADAWYADRLAPNWRRKTIDEAHATFRSLGLDSEAWQLA
jgi:Alkylmercury lyase